MSHSLRSFVAAAFAVSCFAIMMALAHSADVRRCIRHGGKELPIFGLCRDASGNVVHYFNSSSDAKQSGSNNNQEGN